MKYSLKRLFPHIKWGRFYNHTNEVPEGFLLCSLYMLVKSIIYRKKEAPDLINKWLVPSQPISRSKKPVITWIGHATFLIQIGDINILTDPLFGNVSFLYPRILPPGIPLDRMPNIDFILISHNHHDHMETKSLLFLKRHEGTTILVPKGDKQWFDRRGFERINEYTWWDQQEFTMQDGTVIRFTFLPASHWSQRGLFDKNRSLWGSWMIECNGYSIYFAGDTIYKDHFSSIAQEFSSIDTALLPIGPCEPRDWLKNSHMNPQEAGQAFLDMKASHFIPMHWGTFYFGVDLFDTPIQKLKAWWYEHAKRLQDKKLHILKAGQSLLLK